MTPRTQATPYGRHRRGSITVVIVAVIAISMGASFLAFAQVRNSSLIGDESRDSVRALHNAEACAAASVKTLASFLIGIETLMEINPNANANEIYAGQLASNLFGSTSAYGRARLNPWCQATITSILRELPPPGWSTNAGCFRRVSLTVLGALYEPASANTDVTQTRAGTERILEVQGLFGPILCQ